MTCDANIENAKDLVMLIRNAGDTVYELVGGIKTLGYTLDNPVEDATNSATQGDQTESEWTGYSTASVTASGQADKRSGITDAATGLNIVGASRLLEIASSGNRCGKFKILNVATDGYIEGYFNATSFGKTGDRPGLLGFDISLQGKSTVTIVGAV